MKPGAFWPIAIVGVLVITVGANFAILFIARDPNALVVEPHYYEKATHYDAEMALARRSAALGWGIDARFGGYARTGTPLVVALADSTGAPLAGATVKAQLINNLAPEDVLRPAFHESAPGRYETTAALPRAGLWELRLDVHRGTDEFVADLRRDLPAGAAK